MMTTRVGVISPRVSVVPFVRIRHVKGPTPSLSTCSGLHRPDAPRKNDIICHGTKNQDINTGFMSRVQRMSEKYDFLSAFVGSILVTGYFVSVHGQDIGTALSITSMATVVAVVLEEFVFNSSGGSSSN